MDSKVPVGLDRWLGGYRVVLPARVSQMRTKQYQADGSFVVKDCWFVVDLNGAVLYAAKDERDARQHLERIEVEGPKRVFGR